MNASDIVRNELEEIAFTRFRKPFNKLQDNEKRMVLENSSLYRYGSRY